MTAPCPSIVAYERQSGPAKSPLWLAKYADGGMLLPPTFEGDTRAEAERAARGFWESEQVAIAKARSARARIPA